MIEGSNDIGTYHDGSFQNGIDMPPTEELLQLLEAAIKASTEAGKIIASNMGGTEVSKLKANPRDLLTEIDPLCESVIKEIILGTFPDHDFLGEEQVDPGNHASAAALEMKLNDTGKGTKSDYLWIVDPIDGKHFVSFLIQNLLKSVFHELELNIK